MNNREKEILAILRRNPLIQQNEIADMLQISRSRVAAHIMDLMRKGRIKGKGYILTEQEYCVVVGTINMDIRGMADIRYPQAASHPGTIHCSAGGVGRNIAHNLALLGRDVHLLSVIGDDFYGEMLLEETRRAGVNVSGCVRLHGQSTSTYLAIANRGRSRVAAHIMDLMRKGRIKGKGYILTEQEYCVVVGTINMDIRGMADIRYPQAASHPGTIHCSAGGVGRNIAHNLALLGRDVHLLSVIGDDFYGEMLLEETRRAGVNVSGCVRLHGQSTSTYLAIANRDDQTVLAINDTHLLEQLTPQLLNGSRDLLRHAGVVLADCNLTAEALEWVFTLADEIPVFVDTVSEFKAGKIKHWLAHIHTLKPTLPELEILWGQAITSDADRNAAVNALHQQGVQQLFVYLPDESVYCSEKDGEQFLLTAPAHTTVDSFGADDGFMAGLVYSFLEGYSFRDSARFAVACAAISRASGSLNNPTLSADNALSLVPMV